MSKTYLLTRHFATVEWVRDQGINVDGVLGHLNSVEAFQPGDRVLGTLPINLVARLNDRSVEYWHLSLNLPSELRGKELTLAELTSCMPSLERFQAQKVTVSSQLSY